MAVAKFDRAARDVKQLLDVIDRLREAGVGFASVQESVDTTTPVGRAARLICSAGPFEAFEPGVVSKSWTVWVVKKSRPAATVYASITFTH